MAWNKGGQGCGWNLMRKFKSPTGVCLRMGYTVYTHQRTVNKVKNIEQLFFWQHVKILTLIKSSNLELPRLFHHSKLPKNCPGSANRCLRGRHHRLRRSGEVAGVLDWIHHFFHLFFSAHPVPNHMLLLLSTEEKHRKTKNTSKKPLRKVFKSVALKDAHKSTQEFSPITRGCN